MPVPIICLDEDVRHFAERFQQLFSKPQFQYLVTVLLRQIADGPSLAGLSRNLAEAPWKAHAVEDQWLKHFREEMQPKVIAEQQRQRMLRPKRRGRPKQPYSDLGADYFDQLEKARLQRHHIRRLEQLGYTVTLTPQEVA